jgi:hypothetical protein
MNESQTSNWFKPRKRAVVITVLYVGVAIIAINPGTIAAFTAGGTALISLFSILLQSSSPILAFYDALAPEKDG